MYQVHFFRSEDPDYLFSTMKQVEGSLAITCSRLPDKYSLARQEGSLGPVGWWDILYRGKIVGVVVQDPMVYGNSVHL